MQLNICKDLQKIKGCIIFRRCSLTSDNLLQTDTREPSLLDDDDDDVTSWHIRWLNYQQTSRYTDYRCVQLRGWSRLFCCLLDWTPEL